jgi:hypothetical protein
VVPLSQKPRTTDDRPPLIQSGQVVGCFAGVPLRQRSRESCGRPASTVANLRAPTCHPPHVDSRFDVTNIRIGSFAADPQLGKVERQTPTEPAEDQQHQIAEDRQF